MDAFEGHRASTAATRGCPACRREWPANRLVCPDCWTELVDDPSATVRCLHCDRDWPAPMQSCPKCLGELHPGPPGEAMAEYLAAGGHLYRAEDVAPFAGGPECTVLRLAPRSRLVLTGGDGLVEASLVGNDIGAVPPLACEDFGGTPLFRLTRYAAADRALTAAGPDGSSLATFLLHDGGVDVRDETSAPVARLVRNGVGGEWELVETGGRRLATMSAIDHRQEGCVDDEWTLRLLVPRLPLQPFAAVAMVAAAKILLGRAWPEVHELELQQE